MIEQFLKRIAKGLDRQGIPYYDFQWALKNDGWVAVKVLASEMPLLEKDKTPLFIGVVKIESYEPVANGFYVVVKDFDLKESAKRVAAERDLDRLFGQYQIDILPEKFRKVGRRFFLSNAEEPNYKRPFLAATTRVNPLEKALGR